MYFTFIECQFYTRHSYKVRLELGSLRETRLG